MLEGYIYTIENDNFLIWAHPRQKWIEVPCSLVRSHSEILPSILSHYGIERIPAKSGATAGQTPAYVAEHPHQEK